MITLAQVQELLSRQNAAIEKIKQAHSGGGLSAVDETAIFDQLTNTTTQLEQFANTSVEQPSTNPENPQPNTPVTNPNNPFPDTPVENPPVIPAPSPENPTNPDNL